MSKWNGRPAIIVNRRTGRSDDPFIPIDETLTVNTDSKVILSEIPDSFEKVDVSGLSTTWKEIKKGIPNTEEYKVDYCNKIVTFNNEHIGKQLNFSYLGAGNHYLSTEVIYTKASDGSVTETLKELNDQTTNARDSANDAAETANQAATNANKASQNANDSANHAESVASENKTIWKQPVGTYDDLDIVYPSPEHGWTVQVYNDADSTKNGIYRYISENSAWKKTQSFNNQAVVDLQNDTQNMRRNEMVPSLAPVDTDGMTIGDFYMPKTPVILGSVTIG